MRVSCSEREQVFVSGVGGFGVALAPLGFQLEKKMLTIMLKSKMRRGDFCGLKNFYLYSRPLKTGSGLEETQPGPEQKT